MYDKARDKLLDAQQKLIELNKNGKLNRADISQINITLAFGDTYKKLGKIEFAQLEFLKLLKLRKKYFAENPDFDQLLVEASMAEVYGRLSGIYSQRGKPEESLCYGLLGTKSRRAFYNASPNRATNAAELSGALTSLSLLYEKAGDFDKRFQTSTESLELQAKVAEVRSDSATIHNTALKQRIVAKQCVARGKLDEAKRLIDDLVRAYEGLIDISDDQRILGSAVNTFYERGKIEKRLGLDPNQSFDRAESLQRRLIDKSDNIETQGMLLKILASSGKADEAITLSDTLAQVTSNERKCAYAAVGYCLTLEQLAKEDPRRDQPISKAIEMVRQIIGHGYQDFRAIRETDLDFAVLHDHDGYLKMLADEEAKLAD
ncbi:hypothetical protein [Planctomycetes bacterium K23_9]|uniref:Tetratricopeptide repeat protein n=1 Tax=Stieleria marina TaxID=1930275 RepID=A0A517NLX6_9BACT|nr:hypothetical protein K239x_00630 [Planctomycetes bacterium K23_9]